MVKKHTTTRTSCSQLGEKFSDRDRMSVMVTHRHSNSQFWSILFPPLNYDCKSFLLGHHTQIHTSFQMQYSFQKELLFLHLKFDTYITKNSNIKMYITFISYLGKL